MPFEYFNEVAGGEKRLERINSIFRINGNEKNNESLRWQYADSPAGEAITMFAVNEHKDAAVYSVCPIYFKVNSDLIIAAQSLDTLTDGNHRGKGLFAKLANETYELSKDKGWKFVYGFPNSSSGPGFFGKLGWEGMVYPPFKIYFNNIFYPLKYKFGVDLSFRIFNVINFFQQLTNKKEKHAFRVFSGFEFIGVEYDNLWNEFSSDIKVCAWRNSDYIEWRYLNKPNENYRALYLKDVNGNIAAIAIFCVKHKHGGRVGYIMELLYRNESEWAGEVLLKECVRIMSNEKIDIVLAWCKNGIGLDKIYKKSLFINLPRWAQPIKLFFGFRNMSNDVINVNDFFISYSDSDTV